MTLFGVEHARLHGDSAPNGRLVHSHFLPAPFSTESRRFLGLQIRQHTQRINSESNMYFMATSIYKLQITTTTNETEQTTAQICIRRHS